MTLDISPYIALVEQATSEYWKARISASIKQRTSNGQQDQGERSAVTAGNHLDAFQDICRIVIDDALGGNCEFHIGKSAPVLPGYFRATKCWDLIATKDNQLLAVIELKSQAGPSFSNNFNNRSEEVLGSAVDFWTAYRDGAFGNQTRPFLGWLMLVEDCNKSRVPVKVNSPQFEVFPNFKDASYADRYNILCSKLIQENLYTHACLLMSTRDGASPTSVTEQTSVGAFIRSLYGAMVAFPN